MYEQLEIAKKQNNSQIDKKFSTTQMKTYDSCSNNQNMPKDDIESLIQLKPLSESISDNDSIKFLTQRKSDDTSNFTGIPSPMKEEYEQKSGFSFDDVRVHYNSDKPSKLQALAYTQGNQVYIAPGQEKHLGHELGHVIQQKQGIVKPNSFINGLPLNNDQSLEKQADIVQTKSVFSLYNQNNVMNNNVIQQQPINDVIQCWYPLSLLKSVIPCTTKPLEYLSQNLPDGEKKTLINSIITLNMNIVWINAMIYELMSNGFSIESIADIIYGANYSNTTLNLIDNAMYGNNAREKKRYADLFYSCFAKMADYCIKIKQQQPDYDVKSTGSDPHDSGSHALFLDREGHHERIHKGHSLSADNAFVGNDGVLSYFNTLFTEDELAGNDILEGSAPFSTMPIRVDDSTEDFMRKKTDVFSLQEAKKYYYQMGMLECASKVIGATDLHQDNIMPTATGPLVIDAECVFIHAGETCISGALRSGEVGMDVALARFRIQMLDRIRNSDDAYKEEGSVFPQCFLDGFNFMMAKLLAVVDSQEFVDNMLRIITPVSTVRVLPLATTDFIRGIHNFNIVDLQNGRATAIQDIIDPQVDTIVNYITDHVDPDAIINNDNIRANLIYAYTVGTIPAVTVNIATRQVLIDNKPIATVNITPQIVVDKIRAFIRDIAPMNVPM